MSSFKTLAEQLNTNVRKLVQRQIELRKAVEQKDDQLQKLEQERDELRQKLEQVEEKNKILRIAAKTEGSDQREIKLKINEIVREVDKCIAQLNQ